MISDNKKDYDLYSKVTTGILDTLYQKRHLWTTKCIETNYYLNGFESLKFDFLCRKEIYAFINVVNSTII